MSEHRPVPQKANSKRIGKTLLRVIPALIACILLFSLYVKARQHRELSGVRGVNLGSWLVLEYWMTPEVFSGTGAVDEYTLARALPHEEYEALMKNHRASFGLRFTNIKLISKAPRTNHVYFHDTYQKKVSKPSLYMPLRNSVMS